MVDETCLEGFAQRYNGIYYTNNQGTFWHRANTLVNTGWFDLITKIDESIYVAGGAGRDLLTLDLFQIMPGLYRSKDNGEHWEKVSDFFDDKYVTALIKADEMFYAGTYSNGIYYSGNDGFSWTKAEMPNDQASITTIKATDDWLYAGLAGELNPGTGIDAGVIRSLDSGKNWFGSSLNTLYAPVGKLLINKNFIFAYKGGRYGYFQCRSLKGGWIWADPTINSTMIQDMILLNDTLYAATIYNNGVFYSSDWGKNWNKCDMPIADKNVYSLISHKGKLYAGTAGSGIYFSEKKERDWQQANSPMNDKYVMKIIKVNDILYAGTHTFYDFLATTEAGVFESTDDGLNWTPLHIIDDDEVVTDLISVNKTLYAGIMAAKNFIFYSEYYGRGIFYSSNAGESWSPVEGYLKDKIISKFFNINGRLFASVQSGDILPLDPTAHENVKYEGLFYSDDGISWTPSNAPLNDKGVSSIISINNTLYAGTMYNGVYRSTNQGIDWLPINYGMDRRQVNDLGHLPLVNRLYAATEDGVYYQTIDNTSPEAISMSINDDDAYTNNVEVQIFFDVIDADSIRF